MSNVTLAEAEVGATLPTKPICHVYACGGNSILAGTLQYNSDTGAIGGLTAAQKTKYWDTEHTGVWRLKNLYTSTVNPKNYQLKYVKKEDEPLFVSPEGTNDPYSSEMIIFPRLRELYSDSIDIAFCHVHVNGTGFRDIATANWNINETDAIYNSLNLTKCLARNLDLTVKHVEAMGYQALIKGILMIGQSVVDVWDLDSAAWAKADNKTAITEVINYFRTTLGYTNVPFYFTETTQVAGYPSEAADWNDIITELHASEGNCYLHYGYEWWDISDDGTHPDGTSGCLGWGEGTETNGHKNMAELIYATETA